MEQVPVSAQRKRVLIAAVAVILGAGLLIWPRVAVPASPAPITSLALQEAGEADPGAMAVDGQRAAEQQPGATATAEFVVVYISGAVRRPDVYRLPAAARVKDVVLAAGGLADDADADTINLAEHLTDAQHIYVPRQGEMPPAAPAAGNGATAADQPSLLNINTASAAELEGLPGIGEGFAQRIVEYRAANGPFGSLEDLRNVKGIGPSILDQIIPLVTVGP